jgi:hypothetical protein
LQKKVQQARLIQVARIAIGSKVFHDNCTIQLLADGHLELLFQETPTRPTRNSGAFAPYLHLDLELQTDLQSVKCYVSKDENVGRGDDGTGHGSFICFSVMKRALKCVREMAWDFKPDDSIVVEFHFGNDLVEFSGGLEKLDYMRPYLLPNECDLDGTTAKAFCKALLKDNDTARKTCWKSVARTPRFTPEFLSGKEDDEVILVYPFGCDKVQLDNAASDLNELNHFRVEPALSHQSMEIDRPEEEASVRTHYLTISAGDCKRLAPAEYLNDTLIDFWMRWYVLRAFLWIRSICSVSHDATIVFRISRNEEKAAIHYFSTHFYSALCENGTEGVQRWTAKKSINIFEKKFIFVPVNKALHWSLAVVVNPGAIMRHKKWLVGSEYVAIDDDEDCSHQLYPCILFFDSLRAHNTNAVAVKLRHWLNAEWKRTMAVAGKLADNPFTKKTMLATSPKGTTWVGCWNLLFPSLRVSPSCFPYGSQFRTKTMAGIAAFLSADTHMR